MNQFYRDYLDQPVDRFGTACVKWDHLKENFGRDDLVAAWVADMDFRTAPAVAEALKARAEHPIYGYTDDDAAEKAAEVGWLKRRHGLDAQPEWILYSPGVIDSLFFCVRALTAEDDSILIQPPVYGPFYRAVEFFGRKLVKNQLRRTENGWEMDFDDLEAKFAAGVKMMILCSPHNPVGRVWTRAELERVVALANRYGVQLVVDEIHADFTFDEEHRQTRILSLDGTERCVMLVSATKSFNLAGLRQSSILVKDSETRAKIANEIEMAHASTPNLFGAIAQRAAYEHGDEWMDAVQEYIRENRDLTVDFFRKELPEIVVYPQQGTYLMWLDFRGLGMTSDEIQKLLIDEAHVALNNGKIFGEEGDGFFRLNLATPRCNVEKLLNNIKNAIRSR